MVRKLICPLEDKYQEYLHDESKLIGKAVSISFPENEASIAEILARMREDSTPITVQGGKTGIAGCAVPTRGHILNLSKLNRVKEFIKTDQGDTLLKVEPGITLYDLKKEIKKIKKDEELFWPPDPTETTATVGGIASCNAKGICAHLYGNTKKHLAAVKIMQADGTIKEIKRGETQIDFYGRNKDLLDIYLGSEGMLGILTELTLKLRPKPKEAWGFIFFFDTKKDLFSFTESLMNKAFLVKGAGLAAVEYMDRASIDLIEDNKAALSSLKRFPAIDSDVSAMLYLEVHSWREEALGEIIAVLMKIAVESKSNPDRAWAVSGETEIEKMRAFRHAAAESVNIFIDKINHTDPRITKLETYLRLRNQSFQAVITKYETDIKAADLKASIFGHVRDNHFHVNILPENFDQYEKGQQLFGKWAKELAGKKGKIDMQHGVGKLKKPIFLQMAPRAYLKELNRLKYAFDSTGMWNPENMI